MKTRLTKVITRLLCGLFLFFTAPGVAAKKQFVDGEILVKFKAFSTKGILAAGLAAHNHRLLQSLNNEGLVHAQLAPGESVHSAMAGYNNDPFVEYAQPNFIYRTNAIPNDPSYAQQWSLKNGGQTVVAASGPGVVSATHNPGTSGLDMGLEAAWDLVTDCSAVTVAVVDTGLNYNHQDFVGSLWDGGATYPNHGYDYVQNDNDPMDTNGHGTHVAGSFAAAGNNGLGTTGVCWKSKLMAVRALDATGAGTTAMVIQGISFAITNGAKVINLSVGGSSYDSAFYDVLVLARDNKVAVVIAAGNDSANNDLGATPTYPCNYNLDNILCVAALDQTFALASFSNYGSTSVDVGAPGVNVLSTYPGTVVRITPDLTAGWTLVNTGTSPWGYKVQTFTDGPHNALANPTNFNGSTNNYTSSANNTIYKSNDLTGASAVIATFGIYHFLGTGDSVKFWLKSTGGDPTTGTLCDTYTGSEQFTDTKDLSGCQTATCSYGFQLTSDATATNGAGLVVVDLTLDLLTLNATTYDVLKGTSMASPNAAGVVALVLAYNPSFTYADALAAVKGGGTSTTALNGKTVTGKAVNAMGSLAFINAPTGVTVVKK